MTSQPLTGADRAQPQSFHWGATHSALGALVALGLFADRYFTPLSGINGTWGALIAMFGAAALVVGALALMLLQRGGWRATFIVLSWIGALLTIFAAWLLHSWWATGALIVVLIGLVPESFHQTRAEGDRS